MTLISVFNYFTDIAFTLLYFRRRDKGAVYSVPRRGAGLVCLLLTVLLYAPGVMPWLSGTVQRYLLRMLLTLFFVYLARPIEFTAAVYSATYWCTLQLLVQSLFFAPYTFPFFNGTMVFVDQTFVDLLLCMLINLLIKAVLFLTFNRLTPLYRISPVQNADLVPVVFVAAAAIYGRELAVPLTGANSEYAFELSDYYLILSLCMLVLLAYVEYSRRSRRDGAVTELQKQEADALLRNIQDQKENAQAISALRHDLKNHMISLRLLINEGSYAEADRYIEDFLERAAPVRRNYQTGSELVDGILSLKFDSETDIDVKVRLDIRDGGFLSNYELCVLFGNLIDNALEACRNLEEGQKPYISITGGRAANNLLIRFENSASRTPVLVNGLPITIKQNKQLHGFGLRNVNAIVSNHNGNLNISREEHEKFVLTILLPIP